MAVKPRLQPAKGLALLPNLKVWSPAPEGSLSVARPRARGPTCHLCPHRGISKTVTLKRVGRRWYAVIVCEVAVVPLPATGFGMAAAGRLVLRCSPRHKVMPVRCW